MSINIKDVFTGWSNVLLDKFNLLDEDTKKKAVEKYETYCKNCPINAKGMCSTSRTAPAVADVKIEGVWVHAGEEVNGCGCPLIAKLKSDSNCPRGYF